MPGRAPMVPWLMTCVAAAHAYGIDILDGVFNDLSDPEGFERECAQGRDMGFDGKTLIHPNQIGAANASFSPAAEEVEQARKIIAAFDLPENRNKGVVQLGGRMVERMHADMDGFVAECTQGRDMGFDGKTLIHPSQVEPCNAVFSPSAEENAQARRIIDAFDHPDNHGKGVVQIDGRMVERMHADIARRTVAIADAIAKQ